MIFIIIDPGKGPGLQQPSSSAIAQQFKQRGEQDLVLPVKVSEICPAGELEIGIVKGIGHSDLRRQSSR